MSDGNGIDEIREEKLEKLKAQADSPSEPVHAEDRDHLEDLIGSPGVVLVDFYADWCGPCKMLEPTLESVAADTEATVAKVDVDAHQAIAREFGVQGVPMLAVFADGTQVEELVGVQDESTLVGLVEQYG